MQRSLVLISLLALPLATAAADIVRCQNQHGGVTYQHAPCPSTSVEKAVPIASDFPEPNLQERDRLLAREAELHKRLEARRDREVQEAALREARLAREAELERARVAAAEPQYLLVFPNRPYRPPHRPRVWRSLAPR